MSHIVEIRTEIRDPVALTAACERIAVPRPVHQTLRLFVDEVSGHAVWLKGWRYPVVCNLASGTLAYDNYEGRWGEQKELDRLLQSYAVEKATLEARRAGHSVVERPLEDGSIRLTINVGGAV